MNAIVREVFEILHRTAAMRAQLIAILSDGDLAYRLPGGNLTPGDPCRDIGLVERSYIDSFITFRQSFDYPSTDPLLATSVVRLTGWYSERTYGAREAVAAAERRVDRIGRDPTQE